MPADAGAALFHEVDGLLEIRPTFIVPEYLARTCMPACDAHVIGQLAQAAADEWWATVCTEDGGALRPEWAQDFYINTTDPQQNEALEAEAQQSASSATGASNPEASVFPVRSLSRLLSRLLLRLLVRQLPRLLLRQLSRLLVRLLVRLLLHHTAHTFFSLHTSDHGQLLHRARRTGAMRVVRSHFRGRRCMRGTCTQRTGSRTAPR